MRTINIKNPNYRDNLARKKRRRFFIQFLIVVISLMGLISLSVYVAFFSSIMDITEVSINGLKTIDPSEIRKIIEPVIDQSALGLSSLKPRKNIAFFNPNSSKEQILAQFPVIKSVEIYKEYSHKIIVNILERDPIGSWCLTDNSFISSKKTEDNTPAGSCYYFDEDGFFWGKTMRSSGSLLLVIEDMRAGLENSKKADPEFLSSIRTALSDLEKIGIKINKIEIPSDSVGDFLVYSMAGYYIIFSVSSDISKQIDTLRVFLADKGIEFKPQYIDARIEGRIYYK